MDSIEKIKQLTQNIDFDETARRIFEEYLVFCKSSDKVLKVLEKTKRSNLREINPKDVVFMTFGKKNKNQLQHIHHEFHKTKGKAVFEEIYEDAKETLIMDKISFDSADNFVKQIINLTYAFGGSIEPCCFVDDSKILYSLKLKNGKNYCFKSYKSDKYWDLEQLTYWYFRYCMLVYNGRFTCKNKQRAIKRLILKSPLSIKVYEKIKDFFDNEDFIYAIMRYLKKDWHFELFLLILDKNEGLCAHSSMDRIISYVSEAKSLKLRKKDTKIIFLCDRPKLNRNNF